MKPEYSNMQKIDFSNSSKIVEQIKAEISAQNEEISRSVREAKEERERRYEDGVDREKRMIELLESIDKNTSVLSDMVKLLEENVSDQKEILAIINDFNSLATLKNKTERQSLYRKIMDKINNTISDINTINTLYGYGMIIYNTLHTMGKI